MKFFLLQFLVLIISISYTQNYTISGYITDQSNGESIFGANIFSDSLQLGTTSNSYGFYSSTLPAGQHQIIYSYIFN